MSAAPRIKTTVVGSYPVPDWLVAAPSEQALIDATRVVIATQEQAGVDVVCDGELYRFDVNHPETNGMIEYFVRPMQGVRHEMSFDEVMAYRRSPGCAFAPGRRASSTARSAAARSTCRSPASAPRRWRRRPSSSPSPARTCWPRRCSTATTATRPSSRTRSPTCSPSRCAISTPTSSSSTRPTCPAIPRNGSGRHRRSTACSTRCRRRRRCTCASATTAARASSTAPGSKLMRYLNALHADHVVLECAHRPPEELAVFKELQARDRLRPRRGRHQGDRGRVGRRGRARDRARREDARRRPRTLHPSRLRLLDAQAPDRRRARSAPSRTDATCTRAARTERVAVLRARRRSFPTEREPLPTPRRPTHRWGARAGCVNNRSSRGDREPRWPSSRSTSSKTARSSART